LRLWPLLLLLPACFAEAEAPSDAGAVPDLGVADSGVDGGSPVQDSGADAGPIDGAPADATLADATIEDAEPIDSGPTDSGAPLMVVVGYGGRRVMSRDGITFEHFQEVNPNGGDDNDLFRGVTWGNGVFVAVGGSSNAYTMTSTDGYTWINENRTPRAWLGGVAPLGDDFVAAGGNGLRVRSVDDGASWQDDPGYQAIHYRDLASGNGVVVAVGHDYDNTPNQGVIATTTDGVDWMERKHEGATYNNVAFGNARFVAAGPSGRVSRSSDGATWEEITVGSDGGAEVIFDGARFLISRGDDHFESTDAITWTPVTANRGIVGHFEGHYYSLGWPARIFESEDLTNWQDRFSPLGSGMTRIAVGRLR
jgi:hypothetical protein